MTASSRSLDQYVRDLALKPIAAKVQAGERLSFGDGLALYATKDLTGLGALAHRVHRAKRRCGCVGGHGLRRLRRGHAGRRRNGDAWRSDKASVGTCLSASRGRRSGTTSFLQSKACLEVADVPASFLIAHECIPPEG